METAGLVGGSAAVAVVEVAAPVQAVLAGLVGCQSEEEGRIGHSEAHPRTKHL